jgi:hypothetical protein
MTCFPWTSHEDAAVRAFYASAGSEAVAAKTGRSVAAVHHRAQRLGILKNRPWTARDVERLRLDWGHLSLRQIAEDLRHPESSVYDRARALGLTDGAPEGSEYLSAAARRTGWDVSQLRRILAAGRVALRPVTTRVQAPRGARRRWLVDSFEADIAIAAWLSTETLSAAARRCGLDAGTLERWLIDAGERKTSRGKRHWRVSSDLVDRVVREHLSDPRESLREAALRVRVSYPVLSAWLKQAGVALEGKPYRVDRDVVDQVVAEHRARPSCRSRGAA